MTASVCRLLRAVAIGLSLLAVALQCGDPTAAGQEPAKAAAPPAKPAPAKAAPQQAAAPAPPAAEAAADSLPPPLPGDLNRLLAPAVAQQLGLASDQQAAIRKALAERDAALGAAPAEQQETIRIDAARKIAGLLSEEQRAAWGRLAQEPRLRFAFRFQKWSEVLEWFAEQAGLSLVMENPPPGTFNYTDTKEYTTSEAIDLLNSVLLTKGYTLIRRDRMLLVLNVEDGIPPGLTPRVSLDELDRRGKFELVTVIFPLGGRDVEKVSSEIAPLLSPLGRTVALPSTRQLLVTDRAGIMQAIAAIIESIPEPKAKPQQPRTPEKPQLQVYPLQRADPEKAVEVLKLLFPQAAFVADTKANQVSAYATPTQQAAVRKMLDQMEANNPPDKAPRLEVYRLRAGYSVKQLLRNLELAVPKMRLTVDDTGKKLLAWGYPDDHAALQQALDKLTGRPAPGVERQVEVYALKQAEPKAVQTLLESVLDDARVMVDEASRSVVVVASAEDQQIARSLVEKLQTAPEADQQPRFQTYTVRALAPSEAIKQLEPLVPRARFSVDDRSGKLVVWASPEDHQRLATALEQLEQATSPLKAHQLEVFPLSKADPTSTLSLLQGLLPGARLSLDTKKRSLIAIAEPADLQAIRTLLEQLQSDRKDPNAPVLQFYPLSRPLDKDVLAVLSGLAPEAKITSQQDRLMVVASPEDQQKIKEALDSVTSAEGARQQASLVIYPVTAEQKKRFLAMREFLTEQLPGVRVVSDDESLELAIWASPPQHEALKGILKQLEVETPDAQQFRLVVYPLKSTEAEAAQQLLKDAFPDARITVDPATNRLLIWARQQEHEQIQASVQQLDSGAAVDFKQRFRVYPLQGSDGRAAIDVLEELVPHAKLHYDSKANTITAWARPREHEMLAEVIGQLRAGDPDATLGVYEVRRISGKVAVQLLSAAVPQARLTAGTDDRHILVWGSPADQQLVKQLVDQIGKGGLRDDRVLAVYPTGEVDTEAVAEALEPLLDDDAQVVKDDERKSLIIWATAEKHEQIRAALDQLVQQLPEAEQRVTRVYHLEHGSASAAYYALYRYLSDARIGLDSQGNSLVVTARPKEQDIVKATVDQMDQAARGGQPTAQVYQLKSAEPSTLATILQGLYTSDRSVRITADTRNRAIIALARPQQHEFIKQVIDQVEAAGPAERALTTQVYHFRQASPLAAYRALTGTLPEARIGYDLEGNNLVVTARPEDQEMVKSIVEQMNQAGADDAAVVQVYRLDSADPSSVYSALYSLYRTSRDVRVSLDERNRAIIAVAPPDEQKVIQQTIQQIEAEGPAERLLTTRVYHFQIASPLAAYRALTAALPNARIGYDLDGKNLVVTARSEDHDIVKAIVEQMDQQGLDAAASARVYRLKSADTDSVYSALYDLYRRSSDVHISADERSGIIIAVAPEAQQQVIARTIEQIEQQGPPESAPTAKVYHLEAGDPVAAYRALSALLPRARLGYDREGNNLVVTATPEDHQVVQGIVEEMDRAGLQARPTIEVYPLKKADPRNVYTVLQTLYQPDRSSRTPLARISLDARNRAIVAVGPPEQQELIKRVIQQAEEAGTAPSARPTKVYHFKVADPRAAEDVLSESLPDAEIAADLRGNNLVVTASPEDHQVVEATVQQMDQAGLEARGTVRVYRLETADPENLFSMLQSLFEDEEEVQISLDRDNGAVVAVAPEGEQEVIKSLIDSLQREGVGGMAAVLETYDLGERDGEAVVQLLTELLEKEGDDRFQLSVLPQSRQLIAVARPQQQEMIRKALEQLKVEQRKLEVFQLQNVDPFSAQLAISTLFGSSDSEGEEPLVESDSTMQQLMVRATETQLEQIRELLVKMGETQLERQPGQIGSGRTLRVIPFSGDAASAVEEIRRVWPQIRPNQIRVITPAEQVPRLHAPEAKPPAGERKDKPQQQSRLELQPLGPLVYTALDETAPTQEAQATDDTAPETGKAGGAAATSQKPAAKQAAKQPQPPPPVIVIPGEGRITIASQDLEALDQLESLLAALARKSTGPGRNFVVFSLRNAGAVQVASLLQRFFREISGDVRSGTGPVVVVPDERLNAILVHANRSDQAIVENLIRILDSSEVPDSLALYRPKVIPIRNTRASNIEAVLKDVYKPQLTSGGGRPPIEIPRGVPPQVATLLQQINAATSGPLLTLGVDEATNSLVIMAPADLSEEVAELVQQLDEAALQDDPMSSLRIISLKKTNAERIKDALQLLLPRTSRRSRR